MLTAKLIIETLQLKPLPMEGGYYRETYRAIHVVPAVGDFAVSKSACTAIYYLLTPETCSVLHRLPTDEVYHFYLGDAMELLLLEPSGSGRTITLGTQLQHGHVCQFIVPGGCWQGSRLRDGGTFALMGTTMAPGFDFDDFETGERADLIRRYPDFADVIAELTPSL